MTIDSEVFQVIGVGVLYAGEVAALYTTHLRS
jgi:hypothetical protein